MELVLGSLNEAKKEALERAAGRFFQHFEIGTVGADAPDQPVGVREASEGARARALQAYSKSDKSRSLGIGVEGYAERVRGDMYLSVWSAVFDGENFYEGGSGRSKLPHHFSRRLPEEELGKVVKDVMGEDLSEGKGAVGILTAEESLRPEFTERSLIHAFGNMENRFD